MFLDELVNKLIVYKKHGETTNVKITSIEIDSREVEAGSLFVCLEGSNFDGHDFVKDAENNGAVAILAEKEVETSLPVIIVPSSVKALALFSHYFYDEPSHRLNIIGVTGTNGKTTLTY